MKNEALKLADELDTWISCLDCGQRVGRDSIHTCSPQLKPLSDEAISDIADEVDKKYATHPEWIFFFAKAIEERHGIK